MAAYLMCITVSGGVPIFNRKFGDIKSVSFHFKRKVKYSFYSLKIYIRDILIYAYISLFVLVLIKILSGLLEPGGRGATAPTLLLKITKVP